MKRKLDIVIISDVHLGTYACHATELLNYLNSIDPEILVLNGDIIDGWQFSKNYFPSDHMLVLKKILSFASEKKQVYYLSGNHDEILRKFIPLKFGNLSFKNKLVLNINSSKIWIFHGDIYDFTMKATPWLVRLGGLGYTILIIINRILNNLLQYLGKEKISFSKKIKNSVQGTLKFTSDFENTIAKMAIKKKYDYVACAHIHQPVIKKIRLKGGEVTYLNSGDWIENLTSLEFSNNKWNLFRYNDMEFEKNQDIELEKMEVNT